MTVPVLIVSGPVAVGKTSVAEAVSARLGDAVPHSFIEMDALRATYPRPATDRFNLKLGYDNLRAVWANAAVAGARNLIIAHVVEDLTDVAAIRNSVPHAAPVLVQLDASAATLAARVGIRETGPDQQLALARSLELAKSLRNAPSDHRVSTDGKTIEQIASTVLRLVPWTSPTGDVGL